MPSKLKNFYSDHLLPALHAKICWTLNFHFQKDFLTRRGSAKKLLRHYSGNVSPFIPGSAWTYDVCIYILHCTFWVIEERKEPENCEKSMFYWQKCTLHAIVYVYFQPDVVRLFSGWGGCCNNCFWEFWKSTKMYNYVLMRWFCIIWGKKRTH